MGVHTNQNRLGIVGNILAGGADSAGYPNGRRPKDDVVDISLIAVMGGLCMANGTTDALGFGAACNPSAVPLGTTALKLHDGVDQAVVPLLSTFPYLNTPLPGAGGGIDGTAKTFRSVFFQDNIYDAPGARRVVFSPRA